MSDVLEQLRRYGEAVEAEAMVVAERPPVVDLDSRRRRRLVLLSAAAAMVALALGGAAIRLVRTDVKERVVATVPSTSGGATTATTAVSAPTEETTTTEAVPEVATTTTVPDHRPTAAVPVPTTTSTTVATAATPLGATTTTTPSTTTTVPGGRYSTARGRATWTGTTDPRGSLHVGACPAAESAQGCPGVRRSVVAPDGSFELVLPLDASPRDWKVVAYVVGSSDFCIFNCEWRSVQAGPATTISDAVPPQDLNLSVSARIVDVFVRDRNNQPFSGGGILGRDTRCLQTPCPYDMASFMPTISSDGRVRLVLDPALTYDLSGQATNTGWPNPQSTNGGNTFWFSPTIRAKGSDLPEGQLFLVDGAPA